MQSDLSPVNLSLPEPSRIRVLGPKYSKIPGKEKFNMLSSLFQRLSYTDLTKYMIMTHISKTYGANNENCTSY